MPFGPHHLFGEHARRVGHDQEGSEEEDLCEDHVEVLKDVERNCNNN